MRVTRLDIFGFKSFMERLTLPLESGIIGVVGPNGCGKSNIVDALRWVLGETRASQLRGEVLEDVIFNGTDRLRPLGLAEVTLTLRAESENLFEDLVSPSLEAENLFQDALAKATDLLNADDGADASKEKESEAPVQETPVQEAPVRPQLRVIDGGNASAVAENEDVASNVGGSDLNAEDVKEERSAAGDVPESEAQAVAAEAGGAPVDDGGAEDGRRHTLLTRFSWLKSVTEVQVTRRLYRSGDSEYFINKVQCRLKDVREFFRAIGLSSRAYNIVAQGEVGKIITSRPEERRQLLEEAAGVVGFRDKIGAAKRRLEETAVSVTRLDDVIKEVARNVVSLKRQASRARARQELKDRFAELQERLWIDSLGRFGAQSEAAERAKRDAEERMNLLQASLEEAQRVESEAAAAMRAEEHETDALRGELDRMRDEIMRLGRERSERENRLGHLRSILQAREGEAARLEERRSTFIERRAETEGEIAGLAEQEAALAEQLRTFERGSDDELRAIAEKLEQSRAELRKREHAFREARDRVIRLQSTLESAQEQLVAASPAAQLRKTVGNALGQEILSLSSNIKLLADGLKVPGKYTRAVQAILAERAEYLICDDPHRVGRHFVEKALKEDPNNKRGLGLGVFGYGRLHPAGDGESQHAGDGEPMLPAALPRLTDFVQAEAPFQAALDQCLGNVFVAETIEQAIEVFKKLGEGTAALPPQSRIVTLGGEILTQHSFFTMRHEGGLLQLKNRVEEIQGSVDGAQVEYDRAIQARDQLLRTVQELEEQHVRAVQASRERQQKMRELSNQHGTMLGRLQGAQRAKTQIEQDEQRWTQQVSEVANKIKDVREQMLIAEQSVASYDPSREAELQTQLAQGRERWNAIEAARREGRQRTAELTRAVEQQRRQLDQARSSVSQAVLGAQRVEIERQHVEQQVSVEFGADGLERLKALAAESEELPGEARAEFERESLAIRQRIQREGDVDPTSIERSEEEGKRLDELSGQREDLVHAASTLEKTIATLVETSEQRFVHTFNAVRENFQRLVPRLFGGGKAELNLSDPSKPLESGVDIIVRPPGKKPKTIDLLSGGEKALCATALLISMFLEKPSPLCVLDEVDAPLDEANLLRFLSVIREMSTRTQFLVITHNQRTMAAADTLVGVTMQEPGASRVISVSLQEAEKHVA